MFKLFKLQTISKVSPIIFSFAIAIFCVFVLRYNRKTLMMIGGPPMPKREMIIDLHKHGFEKTEHSKADLTPAQFLKQYYAMTQIYGVDIATVCGSHNDSSWGKQVWQLYKSHPQLQQNLKLYPFVEFNVSVGPILTYKDSRQCDDKYIFKKMHLLAVPKKGREQEFFARTEVYSAWSSMYIDKRSQNLQFEQKFPQDENDCENFIEIGTMMKTARNLICQKYGLSDQDRIPFDIYANTIVPGLTYDQIRKRFVDDTFEYLARKKIVERTFEEKKKIQSLISWFKNKYGNERISVFPHFDENQLKMARLSHDPYAYIPVANGHQYSRLDPRDLSILLGDSAHLCVAHPDTINFRQKTDIPISVFDGVDISSLPAGVQQQINILLAQYHATNKDVMIKPDDATGIIKSFKDREVIAGDFSGIVKDEIFLRSLDRYASQHSFHIDAYEISPKTFYMKNQKNAHQDFSFAHYDLYVKYGKAVNCSSALGDKHMLKAKDLDLIDPHSSPDYGKTFLSKLDYACQRCSWLDLIETGSFDKDQPLDVKIFHDLRKGLDEQTKMCQEPVLEK